MAVTAEAWFLYEGDGKEIEKPGLLERESFELPTLGAQEVLAEPLFGCWEGNMGHAVLRKPVDICRQRSESRVIIGNAGVARVLEIGSEVSSVRPGQCAMIVAASVLDRWGYPEKIFAYDAPHTMGCLSTRIHLREHELLALPEQSRFSLAQWAAFSVRYVTAWSNWELAYGTFRLLISSEEMPHPHVWGWGGGTTLAELSLASRFGCKTVMFSGDDRRIRSVAAHGVTPLDRRVVKMPSFEEARFTSDASYRRAYTKLELAFIREVQTRTSSEMVQIFLDYIGTPVLRATLKALAREGVISTAGWKEGMATRFLRSAECIARHQHIHTHYARRPQAEAAVKYAEANGWMPELDEPPVPFDDVPSLSARFLAGDVGYFPVFSINPI